MNFRTKKGHIVEEGVHNGISRKSEDKLNGVWVRWVCRIEDLEKDGGMGELKNRGCIKNIGESPCRRGGGSHH